MKEQQRQLIITQEANRDGSTAKNLRSMKTQTRLLQKLAQEKPKQKILNLQVKELKTG